MYSRNIRRGGFYFRSILEAKWYDFWHCFGVSLKYEEEGYKLPNYMKYIPDFKLYGYRGSYLWAEVKGVNNMQELIAKERDYAKIKSFHEMGHPVIVLPSFPNDVDEWLSMRVTTFEFVNGESKPCIPYFTGKQIKLSDSLSPGTKENVNKILHYVNSLWRGGDNY